MFSRIYLRGMSECLRASSRTVFALGLGLGAALPAGCDRTDRSPAPPSAKATVIPATRPGAGVAAAETRPGGTKGATRPFQDVSGVLAKAISLITPGDPVYFHPGTINVPIVAHISVLPPADFFPMGRYPDLTSADSASVSISTLPSPPPPNGNRYWIIFNATPYVTIGQFGHAFVSWNVYDSASKQLTSQSWGYYPGGQEGKYGILNAQIINNDLSVPNVSDQLVVEVDKTTYDTTYAAGQHDTIEHAVYLPPFSDCVNFVERQAEQVGLNLPTLATNLTPSAYVTALAREVTKPYDIPYNGGIYRGPLFHGPSPSGGPTLSNGDGKPAGIGSITYPNGSTFHGTFYRGQAFEGMLTYSDGISVAGNIPKAGSDVPEGSFKGIPDGNVKVYLPPKGAFVGAEIEAPVVSGQYEGNGTTFYGNGARLEAVYHQGKLVSGMLYRPGQSTGVPFPPHGAGGVTFIPPPVTVSIPIGGSSDPVPSSIVPSW